MCVVCFKKKNCDRQGKIDKQSMKERKNKRAMKKCRAEQS